MTIRLPRGIAAFFEADRRRDPDAVAAAFAEHGAVTDVGRIHRGRAAIRGWMAEALDAFDYTAEPVAVGDEAGRTRVTARTAGTFPGSPVDLRFLFVLDGDAIADLEITA